MSKYFMSTLPVSILLSALSCGRVFAQMTVAGNVVGNARSTGPTFYQWFNTAAFARPGMNAPGNAGRYNVRNPGVANWDLAISKRFNVE